LALDAEGTPYYFNKGNPGTFLTKVYMFTNTGKAIILFANSQSPATDAGLDILSDELKEKYLR
jgi:hypothetical protein